MFPYRHIIFFICIFSIFNYSFYYYFKNLPSLTKLISFDKASFEFINNRTIVIYHAYLIQLTTKIFPKGKWHIRMTAFANKNFKNITNDEGIFVEILNGPKIPAVMFEISESYGDIEFLGKCWWGTWFIDAVIPDMDLKKIDEKVY